MTDGDITLNARELIDKLHDVDMKMYEDVLDTIAWKGYGRLGTWSDDGEGNMILHEDEDFDAETFETQYAGGFGSGSLSDVGLSTNQLTSTWGSGDFDSASLNSSRTPKCFRSC